MLKNVELEDIDAVVDAALREFLLRQEDLPAEVLVPVDFPNRPLLEEILARRRGGPVRILHPQRGSKRRLIDLAEQNAQHLFDERSLSGPPPIEESGEPSGPARAASLGLQRALDLAEPPRDLLCFDISTLGGSESVGSAVWLRDGKAHRAEYRRFRIRQTADGETDDYAMMQEVVSRYFQRRVREGKPLPDLVLIDGGKGQLGAAVQAMEGAGASDLPVAALAKRREEVFLPGRSDPVLLDRSHPSLHWLQRVRDEAHRFAVGYNRRLRRKRTLRTALRDVPGVGRTREAELLRRFGSPAAIAGLSRSELTAVPGIGPVTAERILEALIPPVEEDSDETS